MVSESELVTAGVSAYVAKDIVKQVLGPTAEYLGQETKGLVEKCNINISNILTKAYEKITDKNDGKIVNIRAFRDIINEGKMIEDELFAEYFGGLLASSRSDDGKDDRSVYYINLIKSLSTYQIKIHFLLYYKLFEEMKDDFIDIRQIETRRRLKIYIPEHLIRETFKCHSSQDFLLATHAMSGLSEKSLISKESIFYSAYKNHNFDIPGIITGPTILGIELFLLANGLKDIGINEITSRNLQMIKLSNTISTQDVLKMRLIK